ncbi:MAG: histidine phosphatase family protein [Chloroflexi bacterium]|nr:MAG: histidine phosphatase family protein [Chloroflexota bacterium]
MITTPHSSPACLYLVRHGPSVWNGRKRVSGQMNPPLSVAGEELARNLALVMLGRPLTAIYTSTLTRAIATARPTAISHKLNIHTHPGLKEWHMGILHGRFRDTRDPETYHQWQLRKQDMSHFRIPGGETFFELQQRVCAALRTIWLRETNGHVLIVGHRSTNRVIMAKLMGWSIETAVSLRLRSKYLYVITLGIPPSIQTICLNPPHTGEQYAGFKA